MILDQVRANIFADHLTNDNCFPETAFFASFSVSPTTLAKGQTNDVKPSLEIKEATSTKLME